jgi:hypothetical protein
MAGERKWAGHRTNLPLNDTDRRLLDRLFNKYGESLMAAEFAERSQKRRGPKERGDQEQLRLMLLILHYGQIHVADPSKGDDGIWEISWREKRRSDISPWAVANLVAQKLGGGHSQTATAKRLYRKYPGFERRELLRGKAMNPEPRDYDEDMDAIFFGLTAEK